MTLLVQAMTRLPLFGTEVVITAGAAHNETRAKKSKVVPARIVFVGMNCGCVYQSKPKIKKIQANLAWSAGRPALPFSRGSLPRGYPSGGLLCRENPLPNLCRQRVKENALFAKSSGTR